MLITWDNVFLLAYLYMHVTLFDDFYPPLSLLTHCSSPLHPFSHLWQWPFYFHIIFLFISHIRENMKYVSFWVLLNMMISSSIYFTESDIFYLWLNDFSLYTHIRTQTQTHHITSHFLYAFISWWATRWIALRQTWVCRHLYNMVSLIP
jgi:hypothetical protein